MISVVVAIYNVEKYLYRCLDSLVSQTFDDVEFLLIDDGSTDRSGEIADCYKMDMRFRVYHTSNNGLSATRNLGIQKAHGDWIMFLDGDDFVLPDFCEAAYRNALKYSADMVIFSFFSVKKHKTILSQKFMIQGLVDSESAVKYGEGFVWNKLYRKDLFDEIHFPEGRVYEDLAVSHKLAYLAERIVIIQDALYFHVYRRTSISNLHSSRNKRDGFISSLQRANDIKEFGWSEEVYMVTVISYAVAFLARTYPKEDQVYKLAESLLDSIDEIPSSLSRKKRIMLLLWKIDKRLFHFVCIIMHQKDKDSKQ